MLIISPKVGLGLLPLLVLSGAMWAATIQGEVKGPNGKLLKGVEIRIQRSDKKGSPIVTQTDSKGKYTFKDLQVAAYRLQASAAGLGTTASDVINARADGAVRVDFALKAQGAGVAKKKKTHRVWVAAHTGTNIGGSWVEVPDDEVTAPVTTETGPSADNVGRAGNSAIRGMQQSGGGGHAQGGN